jgi:ectoine hydroxylase-related dioxygenase (phytanoyl-CoA dioxygenase family)
VPLIHSPDHIASGVGKMQCILIGVASPSTESDQTLWGLVTQHVTHVADEVIITWVNYSYATDEEEGQRTLLLCAISDASNTDDVVNAVSAVVERDAELWATAPAILPLRPLDGYDCYIKYNNELSEILHGSWAKQKMKEHGLFFQNALMDKSTVDELREEIMTEIEETEELIRLHHPEINIGKDVISFKEIGSRGNERFDLLLQSSSSKIREIIESRVVKHISPLVESILGSDEVDFDLSVVYSKPGAPDQGWHADGDHQKGASDIKWNIDGWKNDLADAYALCLFIPLIDLDDETGYTQFWPASHQSRGLAGFGPVAQITESTWNGKCKAGDAIWYDYRTMHRGMQNCSSKLRPVVQILFKRIWYKETRNYGTVAISEAKRGATMSECNQNATGAA